MAGPSQDEETHLVQALRRLLRPLVRFLLARGFTYTRLIQILRPLYVELAEETREPGGRELSDSRISVLTGIARRYVRELRESPPPKDPAMLKASPNARLVADWITLPRYLDTAGRPRILSRFSREGGEPGFDELAARASSDVRARTLLDDLVEKGMVRLHDNGNVELLAPAYKPDQHVNDLLDYFGMHLHDHLAAATSNLDPRAPAFFERSAFQDRLSPDSVELLKTYSDEQAMEMLKTVYVRAVELSEADREREDNDQRFRIGAYVYATPEGADDDGDDHA